MTTDAVTTQARSARGRSRRSAEYVCYFTILFVLAIPFATADWIVNVVKRRTLNLRGPLARAWVEADRITPVIFSLG